MAPAVPAVVGIAERAALEVRRQPVGGERLRAVEARVAQPVVDRVGARVPAEVVVEGAVLHHQDDEGVDRQLARAREMGPRRVLGRLGDQGLGREQARHPGEPGERRGPAEEVAPAQHVLPRSLLELLDPRRIRELPAGELRGVVGRATDHLAITFSQSYTPSSSLSTKATSVPLPQLISSRTESRAWMRSSPGAESWTPSRML